MKERNTWIGRPPSRSFRPVVRQLRRASPSRRGVVRGGVARRRSGSCLCRRRQLRPYVGRRHLGRGPAGGHTSPRRQPEWSSANRGQSSTYAAFRLYRFKPTPAGGAGLTPIVANVAKTNGKRCCVGAALAPALTPAPVTIASAPPPAHFSTAILAHNRHATQAKRCEQ
jgi:hypothetical protein